MKKLRIRGKEIRKLGLYDEEAISLAIELAIRHFSHDYKPKVLEILRELVLQPGDFVRNQYFSELARLIIKKQEALTIKEKKLKQNKKKSITTYPVYGIDNIDPEAIKQMDVAMKLPVVVDGALMADAHVGYGLPIGGVVATYNAVMPYGVGMDIGCRMCLSVYPISPGILKSKTDLLKKIVIENSRFGLAEFNDIGDHELMERKEFVEIKFLKSLREMFYSQLGTSGHGNHFVDLGYLDVKEDTIELGIPPGEYFSVLSHSGSRNFGAEIARYYTKIAADKLGFSGEAGKLAWLDLDSAEGQEYWKAMTLAGDYSAANHRIIHYKISKALGETPVKTIENHHNFAWKEKLSKNETLIVHRKGATPAKQGDVGIIPGNMVSPAFVVSGKGAERSLFSASHGAGRQMSRNKAKDNFTNNQLGDILRKADVLLIGGNADESPQAYKDIYKVMEAQKDLVNVLALFYPKIVRME